MSADLSSLDGEVWDKRKSDSMIYLFNNVMELSRPFGHQTKIPSQWDLLTILEPAPHPVLSPTLTLELPFTLSYIFLYLLGQANTLYNLHICDA